MWVLFSPSNHQNVATAFIVLKGNNYKVVSPFIWTSDPHSYTKIILNTIPSLTCITTVRVKVCVKYINHCQKSLIKYIQLTNNNNHEIASFYKLNFSIFIQFILIYVFSHTWSLDLSVTCVTILTEFPCIIHFVHKYIKFQSCLIL